MGIFFPNNAQKKKNTPYNYNKIIYMCLNSLYIDNIHLLNSLIALKYFYIKQASKAQVNEVIRRAAIKRSAGK